MLCFADKSREKTKTIIVFAPPPVSVALRSKPTDYDFQHKPLITGLNQLVGLLWEDSVRLSQSGEMREHITHCNSIADVFFLTTAEPCALDTHVLVRVHSLSL